MLDPVTLGVGTLVAQALAAGAAELAKGALGEAAKDAYSKMKALVLAWAGTDVQALEAKPTAARKAVIAEAVNERSVTDQLQARELAAAFVATLKEQAASGGPVGIDVGRLEALEVDLGKITVREGTGFRAEEVKTTGKFTVGDLVVGPEPGKS